MSNSINPADSANPAESGITDYQALLLGLAKSQNPEAEVAKLLVPSSQKKEDKSKAWRNPLLQKEKEEGNSTTAATSVQTIFRLAGIVQATLQSEILNRTQKITLNAESDTTEPDELRKELQGKSTAGNLICALQPRSNRGEPLENWEATSRATSLSELKQRTIVRACMVAEDIFQAAEATPETKQNLEDGIKLFREVSRNFEISLAAKNNTQAGPGKAGTQVRNIPPKGLEIISCITQIAIECVRNTAPELPKAEEDKLRAFQMECRRAFGAAWGAKQGNDTLQRQSMIQVNELLARDVVKTPGKKSPIGQIQEQWKDWKTPEGESISAETAKVLGALFMDANLNPENQALLRDTMEKAASDKYEQEETLEKEWLTVRHLQKIYDKLNDKLLSKYPLGPVQDENAKVAPSTQELVDAKEPLILRVFAALKREKGSLGKASSMVLIGKILGTSKNQKTFQKQEQEEPNNILEAFGFVRETAILQQEAGRTLQTSGYGPNERNQLQELSEIATELEYAESILYSRAVISTLHNEQREKTEIAAHKIMGGERPTSELEREVQTTYKKTSETIEVLESEIQEFKENTENLPKLLADQEAAQTLNGAIARLIRTAENSRVELEQILDGDHKEPIKNAARALLLISEKTSSEDGRTSKELVDISKKIGPGTPAPQESLGRLIANLAENRGIDGAPAELDEVAKIILLQNFETSETPMDPAKAEQIVAEENLKIGRDKETPFGKVKTPELAEIVRITNDKTAALQLRIRAQSRFIRDLGTIRRWREKTTGMSQKDSKSLAVNLCKTSPALKRACETQILKNIETCCQPPSWNDHVSMEPEEIKSNFEKINQSYSILQATFKREENHQPQEKELFGLIQKLKTLTEEIHGKTDSRWVRSEELAAALSDNNGELRSCQNEILQKLVKLPQGSKLIEPTIDMLQTWSNYTGNREAVIKSAILLPKEKKSQDRVNTASYLAATIEAHGTNLKELHGYMKAVVDNPEALAETLLQHQRNKRTKSSPDQSKNNWEAAMLEDADQSRDQAQEIEAEIETMTNIFESKIQEASQSKDTLAREEFLDPRFHRAFNSLIQQKERELQRLLLRESRLRKLVRMSQPQAKETTQVKTPNQATVEEDSRTQTENTIAHALDLALTANKQKLSLPKQIQKTAELEPREILDASRAHQRISLCKELLQTTAQRLREYNPKAQEFLDEAEKKGTGPAELCQQLKGALFESIKTCEIVMVQGQHRMTESNPALASLKSKMLQENPELETQQRKWRATLTGAATNLESAMAVMNQPKGNPSKGKTPEPEVALN